MMEANPGVATDSVGTGGGVGAGGGASLPLFKIQIPIRESSVRVLGRRRKSSSST
jgi:hypothetical protein